MSLKLLGYEADREKSPLMKDLHEVGLKHGYTFVVLALPVEKDGPPVRVLNIDHNDGTTPAESITRFTAAGVMLIQCAQVMRDASEEPAPAESP